MFFKVKKIHADAHLPVRKTTGSAGYDLYAYESSEIESRRCRKIPTGLKMEIPEGYYGKIESRSSLALDNLHVEGGVIDSDYRGEVSVILCNNNDNSVKGMCFFFIYTNIDFFFNNNSKSWRQNSSNHPNKNYCSGSFGSGRIFISNDIKRRRWFRINRDKLTFLIKM